MAGRQLRSREPQIVATGIKLGFRMPPRAVILPCRRKKGGGKAEDRILRGNDG